MCELDEPQVLFIGIGLHIGQKNNHWCLSELVPFSPWVFSCACTGQLLKLPTLDKGTCFESIPIQESAADTILKASKFILGLSAYIGT